MSVKLHFELSVLQNYVTLFPKYITFGYMTDKADLCDFGPGLLEIQKHMELVQRQLHISDFFPRPVLHEQCVEMSTLSTQSNTDDRDCKS